MTSTGNLVSSFETIDIIECSDYIFMDPVYLKIKIEKKCKQNNQ